MFENLMDIRSDGKIYDVALIAAYNNLEERKVVHYDMSVMLIKEKSGQFHKFHDREGKLKEIELPYSESIIRTKITKEKAKRLMAEGVKVTAGYALN